MPVIRVNEVNLYYELHGVETADVVVLSNGIFMSTASWGYQVAELKKHFRVLVYDCRGMWQSEHPTGPYSLEQHADDLAALLDALKIEKAHLVGISYGGEISMLFSVRHPEKVRSLVVSSAVSEIDTMLKTIGQAWAGAMLTRNGKTLFEVTLPSNFSEAWLKANQALLPKMAQKYDEIDFTSVGELMAAFSRLDFTAQLKKIQAPTLVVVGEEDMLKPRKYSEIIAREIPGAEFLVIPHAAHAVCLEKPSEFNSALLGFILKHCEVVA